MKKWIVIVLCIVMALSMAACGEKDNGETTVPTEPSGETGGLHEETVETTVPQETEYTGFDPSWAEDLDNEAAAQISDPALRGWEGFVMDDEVVMEDGSDALYIMAYPAGNSINDSNRYNVCTAVRAEAESLAEEMRYCGFTLNQVVTSGNEVQLDKETWIPGDYSFEADNEAGYHCTIKVTSGKAEILISIEKIPAETATEATE